jgi:hypothetical protein
MCNAWLLQADLYIMNSVKTCLRIKATTFQAIMGLQTGPILQKNSIYNMYPRAVEEESPN